MKKFLTVSIAIFLLAAHCGCSSISRMPNPFGSVNGEPRRCVAVWSPAARVVGGVPERGFAARVTFFDNKSKKGVKIDGDILVSAFDEYPGRSASNNVPDKSYPFLAEDVKKLHSHSKELGHSYTLWVPWDNAGPEGERKTVSLIVKLVQKNGATVPPSGQAKCFLPGKEPMIASSYGNQNGDIKQVGYRFGRKDRFDENLPEGFRDWTKKNIDEITPEEREISSGNRPLRMVTTSISIPRNAIAAVRQGGSPVPTVIVQNQLPPQTTVPAYEAYEAPASNPITPASYSNTPAAPSANPQPTDRVERQGNATITYSNEPRRQVGF